MRTKWQVPTLVIIACWNSVLAAQNYSAEIQGHYQKAREAIARHDLQRASEEYGQILKLDPRNAEIYAALGVTLYALGKPAEALSALQSALALDPSKVSAEVFLGLSRSDLGQCGDAIPLLRKHFTEQTESRLRRMVGLSLLNCYAGSSELDPALDLARSLKRSYPDDPDVLYHLAELYSQLSKAAVDEMLKKHPDSYRIHQLAGETLEAQGRYAQALRESRKALEINPKVPRIHYRIGNLLLLEGSGPEAEGEALEHFRQELAINPGDAASEYQMAEIFRKRDWLEEARNHFLRTLELNRNFAEARVGLAKVYAAQHQPEKALKELEQAIRLRPEDSASHYTLMVVYRDLGRTEDAKRELSVFQDLEAKKEKDFRLQLQMLLTGKKANRQNPP